MQYFSTSRLVLFWPDFRCAYDFISLSTKTVHATSHHLYPKRQKQGSQNQRSLYFPFFCNRRIDPLFLFRLPSITYLTYQRPLWSSIGNFYPRIRFGIVSTMSFILTDAQVPWIFFNPSHNDADPEKVPLPPICGIVKLKVPLFSHPYPSQNRQILFHQFLATSHSDGSSCRVRFCCRLRPYFTGNDPVQTSPSSVAISHLRSC